MIMTLAKKEVPTNFVPAVAVKRGGLVLFNLTGRKGCVGGKLGSKQNTRAGPVVVYVYFFF